MRGPSGASAVSVQQGGAATLAELRGALAEATGVPPERQAAIRAGFPPKALAGEEAATLLELGVANGDALVLEEGPQPAAPPQNAAPPQPAALQPAAAPPPALRPAAAPVPPGGGDGAFAAGASGLFVVRRVVDADNSCLFRSVAYLLEGSRSTGPALRDVVARTVLEDPEIAMLLEKEPEEYAAWVRKDTSWGGAVELAVLARHFRREIAAWDIRTQRCDVYGSGDGYAERCQVCYDGLHYDALALTPVADAPEDFDMKVYPVVAEEASAAEAGARALVADANRRRQFTDTHNFSLRCLVCQVGLVGEKEAREHAAATGHTNFSEYR